MPKYASASSAPGFYPAGHWVAANQPLSLIYPLADGVTNANARHRWAYYDGVHAIQYQIPIVALGGSYPYVFAVDASSAAIGMTIGAVWGSPNYGVLTWSPSGSVTNQSVTVTITDQQLNTVQAVFTVSTSSATAHFVFLDAASGSDSGTGTYSAPWQTLPKAFGSSFAATGAGAGAICYMKATGTYSSAGLAWTDNDINTVQHLFEMNVTQKPIAMIGLGGQAKIDWTSGVQGIAIGDSASDFFIANLNPDGWSANMTNQYWVYLASSGGPTRFTEWNVTWTNSGYGSTGDSVASPHTASNIDRGNTMRSYIALLNFSEPNRKSGQPGNNYAGFCFYTCQYWVADGFSINNPSAIYDAVCYAKGTNQNFENRNHYINVTSGGVGGVCTTPGFYIPGELTSTSGEVRYCCMGQNATGAVQRIGTQTGTYGRFYLNRNTLIGYFDNEFGGTAFYTNNVVQTTATPFPLSASSTLSGNVTATSGIINPATLQLQGSALSSVGMVGAQIAPASSAATPAAPLNLRVT